MQGVRPINQHVYRADTHGESSLVGGREIEDDLLLFNCIHHLIIQEYLKGMMISSFRLEFDSLRTLIGKYNKAEALCKQPVGSA